MSIRFRKSVSLGKGARVNFSKSGASLSLGPRGSSLSLGKNGAYANLGIPGTGLSIRRKVGGSRSSSAKSPSKSSASSSKAKRQINPERAAALAVIDSHAKRDGTLALRIGLTDVGEVFYEFTDTGETIADKSVIRELKKFPEVESGLVKLKDEQRKLWEKIQSESEEASREFIDIYKLTPEVTPAKTFVEALAALEPETYKRAVFPERRPMETEMEAELAKEADQSVSSFFGRKRKIAEYADANRERFFRERMAAWETQRALFDEEQDAVETQENSRLLDEYRQKKSSLEVSLSKDDEVMETLVWDWLVNLTLPADVSAQIECVGGAVYLDLDLPEIEDLPSTTTKQLKSGQVKVVDKTQKRLKQEYATCVLGLAFFLAGSVFNLNANIAEITISGYTQRRNKDGDIADDYIYSVRFPREKLEGITVTDPLTDFNGFENRMKLSQAFTFGKIKPYGLEGKVQS